MNAIPAPDTEPGRIEIDTAGFLSGYDAGYADGFRDGNEQAWDRGDYCEQCNDYH